MVLEREVKAILPSFKLLYFEAQKKAVFECRVGESLFVPAILANGFKNQIIKVTIETVPEEEPVTTKAPPAPTPVTPVAEVTPPESWIKIKKNLYLTPEGAIKQYRPSTARFKTQVSRQYVEKIYRIAKTATNEKEAVDKIVQLALAPSTARYDYNLIKRSTPLLEKIFEKPTPKPTPSTPLIELPKEVEELIKRKREEEI